MYSKNKGLTDREYILTPPPGYDGSRFRKRSDGRDDAFPMYSQHTERIRERNIPSPCTPFQDYCANEEPTEYEECSCSADTVSDTSCTPCKSEEKEGGIISFLQGIGGEELLLIALIILLCNDNKAGIETILILALLLCVS